MANALGPWFVRIYYHSPQAPHIMTLPTRTWSPDGSSGTFLAWNDSAVVADTMIEALCTKMQALYPSDCSFDSWQVFHQATPSVEPIPVKAGSIAVGAGTSTDASWASASELIFSARSDTFGICKLTLLDAVTSNTFTPVLTLPSGVYLDLFNEWSSVAKAWAARDNGKPTTFLKLTTNINQALRKEYRYD